MTISHQKHSAWMTYTLLAAALYNILFGAWTVLFPNHLFELNHIALPNYPELWQCVGMIVGVYGLGYFIAAFNPLRHWPIILVGLLGKIFGPIGFAKALWVGSFPLSFGAIILTNDLIWWVPFFIILKRAYDKWLTNDVLDPSLLATVLQDIKTSKKETLAQISQNNPTLVVLLRHKGCTFCREALADLAAIRPQLEGLGVTPVIVHQSEPIVGQSFLEDYALGDWHHISDPEQRLYRALGLQRGTFGQLFGLQVFKRGWEAGVCQNHGIGSLDGDGFQMPGLVLLQNNQIVYRYDFKDASDRPDYIAFVKAGLLNIS